MVGLIDETEDDLRRLIEADLGPLDANADLQRAALDWLHFRARAIPARPRRVILSREAESQRITHPAIDDIASLLRTGGDLRPWLSDSVRDKRKANPKADMMFNDWGITHFHLGRHFTKPDKIDRTGPLLFVQVRSNLAVLLDVRPHRSWAMKHLLRILLRTQPHEMERCELKGILADGPHHTEAETICLRKAGVTTPIKIDGRVFVPSLGVATSGDASRLGKTLFPRLHELRQKLGGNEMPKDLLTAIEASVGVPVRIGVRVEGAALVAYDKNRGLRLAALEALE